MYDDDANNKNNDNGERQNFAYNEQSNNTRFIYTLTGYPRDGVNACRLRNGLYFSKESKSDEKLCFTETNILNISRTIFFMYAFNQIPRDSMYDIIYTGNVEFIFDKNTRVKENVRFDELIYVLDSVLGSGFCRIARRPIVLLYYTYIKKWRFYNYGQRVALPSANDLVDTYRFIKTPITQLSMVSSFILSRTNTDYKVPLQQQVKRLQ